MDYPSLSVWDEDCFSDCSFLVFSLSLCLCSSLQSVVLSGDSRFEVRSSVITLFV
jgi:hypothetical protein